MYEYLREDLARVCALCYDRGHVSGTSGNISVRTPDGNGFLIKASGTSFAGFAPENLLFVDWEGHAFECEDLSVSRRIPSVESGMHAGIYLERQDAGAVVHLHSPYATALSGCAEDEIPLVSAETRAVLRRVPIIPTREAGSRELAYTVREVFSDPSVTAAALKEHGTVTAGKTLQDAYNNADILEHNAHVAVIRRMLGN